MKSNRKKIHCNITPSILYKIFLLPNRNLTFSKGFIFHPSLLCIFVYIFLVFIGIDTKYGKHNIINAAWSDEINGTENTDNINGTINRDKIKGFGSNDIISGREAGDDISGGSGNDTIYGNDGRDILKGKAGNDHIEGGAGNDKISGDRGNDLLIGGPGKDTLTGGLGADIFICGPATDTIIDFNVTQKDTTPENDCDNIKYINSSGNTTTAIQEPEQNDNFFFGLFK